MAVEKTEQLLVSRSMRKFGGSFTQALGVALVHADPDNAQRIKSAFPELWDGYLDYACAISLRISGHISESELAAQAPAEAEACI